MKKKCQAAVEFLILFAIALTMLTGFMYFARGQFDTINEKQIVIDANALADNMINYVVFSLRTPHLKVKDFRLPIDLGGREYTATLVQDIKETYLVLNLTDTGRLFFYSLKKRVNGTIDKSSTYAHCITAKEGKADISPSMIQLEPGRIKEDASWRDINESDFEGDVLQVEADSKFSLYIKGNCFHDLKELRLTIESPLAEIYRITQASDHERIESGDVAKPYGGTFFSSDAEANLTFTLDPSFSEIEIVHQNPEIGPVGSDRLVEVVFTTPVTETGLTKIEMEPTYIEDDLIRLEPILGDSIEVLIYMPT